LNQRKTQTRTFWQNEFKLTSQDVELISNRILEENNVLLLKEIALLLIQRYCDIEEQELLARQEGKLYQPKEHYELDDKVLFPQLGFQLGTVKQVRPGNHPDYDAFSIIEVQFKENSPLRAFVADFEYDHFLNRDADSALSDLQGIMQPDEIYQTHRTTIQARIRGSLNSNDDFIRFQDRYFLVDLLPDFQEGLFNIADAAIDINDGPLPVDNLIEQMGLAQDGEISEIIRFSVNCRLAADKRFDDVGPTNEVLWYLNRLEPIEIFEQPSRLQIQAVEYNADLFNQELYDLLADIDDDATYPEDIPEIGDEADFVTIALSYPYLRTGTLPLTPKTATFFPSSKFNPVLVEFIDGRTGDTFNGWVVNKYNYIFGLEDWYKKYNLPVGIFITLQRTETPQQVIIQFDTVRGQRDWIRQALVNNNIMAFRMNTGSIGYSYDELMMIGDDNQARTDQLWGRYKESKISVFETLCNVFPELAKLSPQSTVHAKTLYTAVNMVQRVGPGPIFHELISQPCFVDMEHGYWSFNPKLKE